MADAKVYAVFPALNTNAEPQQYDFALLGDNLDENTQVEVTSSTHTWASHKCKPHAGLLFAKLKPAKVKNGVKKAIKPKFLQIEQISITVQNGTQAPASLPAGTSPLGVIDDPD